MQEDVINAFFADGPVVLNMKNEIQIQLVSPFSLLLFILFFLAKIFDKIDWSWWWVFSPLWIPLALILCIYSLLKFVLCICYIIEKI